MKIMRTVADSGIATSESDNENSYNTDNEVETVSASESDSDNADDTSSEEGDEYESDPWAPLKCLYHVWDLYGFQQSIKS